MQEFAADDEWLSRSVLSMLTVFTPGDLSNTISGSAVILVFSIQTFTSSAPFARTRRSSTWSGDASPFYKRFPTPCPSPYRVSLNKPSVDMNYVPFRQPTIVDASPLSNQLERSLAAALPDHRLETTPSARWLARAWCVDVAFDRLISGRGSYKGGTGWRRDARRWRW